MVFPAIHRRNRVVVNPRYLRAEFTHSENACQKSAAGDADAPGKRGRPKTAVEERDYPVRVSTSVPLFDPGHAPNGWYSVERDITFGPAEFTAL